MRATTSLLALARRANDRLADCGLISINAAAVRAQELTDRPTDDDHEH